MTHINQSRRGFVKAGAVLGLAPAFISSSVLASSGQLNLYSWSDYVYPEMLKKFTKDTGIQVKLTTYGSNDEVLNKVRASRGGNYDIVMPSVTYASAWAAHDLLQPIKVEKIAYKNVIPSMWKSSATSLGGEINGKRLIIPFNWGTEGLTVDTKKIKPVYGQIGYGDLWKPEHKGKVTVRAHSSMLGMGLYLESQGKIKSNRMLDTYKNEKAMRAIYEQILRFAVANKPSIVQFWSNAQETEAAFLQNGAVIGHTWDGPGMRLSLESKRRYAYIAPKEGALTWMDGLAIPKNAKNIEQAYAWINWNYQPENAALHVKLSGYNSCITGAEKFAGADYLNNFKLAYPAGAIDNLWWYPPEPVWFINARNEFRDRFLSA